MELQRDIKVLKKWQFNLCPVKDIRDLCIILKFEAGSPLTNFLLILGVLSGLNLGNYLVIIIHNYLLSGMLRWGNFQFFILF